METSEETGIPQPWNPISGIEFHSTPNCFFNPNCEPSIDQTQTNIIYESTFSSIDSSPLNSHPSIPIPGTNDNIVLRELIGKLGSICNNPNEGISGNNSVTNSCYNTPLNSPPKDIMSVPGNDQLPFHTDPGFVERAAKLSTLCGKNESLKKISGFNNNIEEQETVSESGMKGQNGRKRKGKGKETQSSTTVKDGKKVVAEEAEKEESDAKRSKSNEKSTEPPKDYIHVRARRGQATDSHSLAERVRREKISERMKFLQDLVPGCNKVTGKAVMLDEIINYVQSLQRQVEFLSMKLATVNPRMDATIEALLSKDMFRPMVSMPNNVIPFDAPVQPLPYGFQAQINGMVPDGPENQFSMNPLMAAMHRNSIMKPPHIDGFCEASTFWENDLQSIVKMATGQDQPQGYHGQMKVEL